MDIVKHVYGSTYEWSRNDITLQSGEIGVEKTVGGKMRVKVGDGSHSWSELAYIGGGGIKEMGSVSLSGWSISTPKTVTKTFSNLSSADAILFEPSSIESKKTMDSALLFVQAASSGYSVTFTATNTSWTASQIDLNYIIVGG